MDVLPKPSWFHAEGRRVVENVWVASLCRALLEVGQRQLGHQVCASEMIMWNEEVTKNYFISINTKTKFKIGTIMTCGTWIQW